MHSRRNPSILSAFWLGALLALGASLPACVGEEPVDEEPKEERWDSLSERPCPEDSFLTYEDFGAPFVRTQCNTCHSVDLPAEWRQDAPVGVNFDTLLDVRFHAERIWARAGDHNATMPPVGGPHEEDRTMLGEWLACGAPGDAE